MHLRRLTPLSLIPLVAAVAFAQPPAPKPAKPAPAKSAAPPSTAATASSAAGPAVQIIMGKGGGRKVPGQPGTASQLGNAPMSEIVRAAKETKRKKSLGTTKVITSKQVGREVKEDIQQEPLAVGTGPAAGYDSVRDSKGRNEDWWRQTMKTADGRISSLEERIATLDTEIAGLRNAFSSMDDPAYRDGVIKPKWDNAVQQQEKAREDLAAAKISKEALLEDARRSGALPGWLR